LILRLVSSSRRNLNSFSSSTQLIEIDIRSHSSFFPSASKKKGKK
jgi:hypothetical protein